MAIDYDKGLLVAADGGDTTHTHTHTRTEVTGVGHNVETGNLALQRLVGRLEGQTLHLIHIKFLGGY